MGGLSHDPWAGRRVLLTGVCGTVGRELLNQLAARQPSEIVGLDNNESAMFFAGEQHAGDGRVRLELCDVRDRDRLTDAMRGVDVVLHAAGLKHVLLCERSPAEAVETNILGTQNVIRAAIANGIERALFTSSDKAVNPTNVMGTSKLMAERLMTAANAYRREGGPVFASTRFGNVLGSRGSVLPLFRRQIANGGPVTLTDPDMTRFIMTLEDAVRLVMDSALLARGGEVFVTKMHAVRIVDLAAVMIEELAPTYGHDPGSIEITVIGAKAGEKLYEELMNEEETRRTVELPRYFVVLPAFKAIYESIDYEYPAMGGVGVDRPYNSRVESTLSREELREYLRQHRLLEIEVEACES